MRARLATVFLGAALIAGCGGGDGGDAKPTAADARAVARDFVTALNARDGKRICSKLVTRSYLRESTNSTGAAAQSNCVNQIQALRAGTTYRIRRVRSATVEGDRATVVVDLQAGAQRRRSTLRMRRDGATFRLESGTTG